MTDIQGIDPFCTMFKNALRKAACTGADIENRAIFAVDVKSINGRKQLAAGSGDIIVFGFLHADFIGFTDFKSRPGYSFSVDRNPSGFNGVRSPGA